MVELPNSTNSVLKMIGIIGTASIISFSPSSNFGAKIPVNKNRYSYECTSENQCFYQLKNEPMQYLLDQNHDEPIIDIKNVKTMKVKFNKPKRLEFYSVENEEGFLG